MSARRSELTREAARLFAERGYHGTSIGDLAQALGVQKGRSTRTSLPSDLLYETMREGANAFHGALDSVPDEGSPSSGSAWRCVRICASSPSSSTSRPSSSASGATWKASGEKRSAERRSYEDRFRALFREGRELGEFRTDLDDAAAALLVLSAMNWAYTWLSPGRDTDDLADRFFGTLLDGVRGYATRAGWSFKGVATW